MDFKFREYRGNGVNHDQESFEGRFLVEQLPGTPTKSFRYIAVRVSDGLKVHEELGLLSVDEQGGPVLHSRVVK